MNNNKSTREVKNLYTLCKTNRNQIHQACQNNIFILIYRYFAYPTILRI